MKIRMQPVEMIAWFQGSGRIHPVRYRLVQEGETMVIRVDRVLHCTEEKQAGNRMLVYRCQSVIQGTERVYELKYELQTCRWFLYKL